MLANLKPRDIKLHCILLLHLVIVVHPIILHRWLLIPHLLLLLRLLKVIVPLILLLLLWLLHSPGRSIKLLLLLHSLVEVDLLRRRDAQLELIVVRSPHVVHLLLLLRLVPIGLLLLLVVIEALVCAPGRPIQGVVIIATGCEIKCGLPKPVIVLRGPGIGRGSKLLLLLRLVVVIHVPLIILWLTIQRLNLNNSD